MYVHKTERERIKNLSLQLISPRCFALYFIVNSLLTNIGKLFSIKTQRQIFHSLWTLFSSPYVNRKTPVSRFSRERFPCNFSGLKKLPGDLLLLQFFKERHSSRNVLWNLPLGRSPRLFIVRRRKYKRVDVSSDPVTIELLPCFFSSFLSPRCRSCNAVRPSLTNKILQLQHSVGVCSDAGV